MLGTYIFIVIYFGLNSFIKSYNLLFHSSIGTTITGFLDSAINNDSKIRQVILKLTNHRN